MTRRPTDEPGVAELLAVLRAVDADAPAARLDVDDLLWRARRSKRRRRSGWWAAGLAGAAAVGLAVAVPTLVRWEEPAPAVPAAAGVATTSTPSVTTSPSTPPAPTLRSVFGPDWSTNGDLPGGYGGDLALRMGSPTSAGLPSGYQAAVRAMTLSAGEYSSGLCAALVEKGATSTACRAVTTPDGRVVQRVDTDAPNVAKIGTWANLRLMYQRRDGSVQLVDVIVSHPTGTTTSAQRAAARAWLDRQLAAAEMAVTTVAFTVGPKG